MLLLLSIDSSWEIPYGVKRTLNTTTISFVISEMLCIRVSKARALFFIMLLHDGLSSSG